MVRKEMADTGMGAKIRISGFHSRVPSCTFVLCFPNFTDANVCQRDFSSLPNNHQCLLFCVSGIVMEGRRMEECVNKLCVDI
jgi:hypothetical protein